MTKSLLFLLQAALASAAVFDSTLLHARQAPAQESQELDLSNLGLLGKIIPKGFKPPPGTPLPPYLLSPPIPVKLFSRVEKPATIRPKEAKRYRASWGPFELLDKNAAKSAGQKTSLDPNGQSESFIISDGLCSNCTILGGNVFLTDSGGNIVGPKEGVYTHHFISMNIEKEGIIPPIARCAAGDTPPAGQPRMPDGFKAPVSTFIGRGEDGGSVDYLYTSPKGRIDFGYHLRKGDRILVNADLVNYGEEKKSLYLTYEIEYVEGLRGTDAMGGLISVGGCDPFAKPNIGRDRTVTNSKEHLVVVDSTIVSARGHLHPGGEKMLLKVNGKEVCESLAEYDSQGYITSMTLCPNPIPIKKGDTVSMVSIYDVQKHPLRPGADHHDTFAESAIGGGPDIMGMWIIAFG